MRIMIIILIIIITFVPKSHYSSIGFGKRMTANLIPRRCTRRARLSRRPEETEGVCSKNSKNGFRPARRRIRNRPTLDFAWKRTSGASVRIKDRPSKNVPITSR